MQPNYPRPSGPSMKTVERQLNQAGRLLEQGFDTYTMRNQLGLKKTNRKLSNGFDAHCVDSWILANSWTGGHIKPENQNVMLIEPIQLHRRQLHVLQPAKNSVRRLYGSTRSLGFKRGSLVKHKKYGISYVGGTSNGRISLHSLRSGDRLCQNAKPTDCVFLTYNQWKAALPPHA